jgi:peroxiredoxin
MLNWKTLSAAAAVAIASAGFQARAQVNEDAKAVLDASAQAIGLMKGVNYKSKLYGVGALAALIDGEGDVKQARTAADPKRTMFWARGQLAEPGKGKSAFAVSSDGKTVWWEDAPSNVLYERPYQERTDQDRALSKGRQISLMEFMESVPFNKELKAEKLEITGAGEVRGQPCQIVKASWENGNRSFTWYISLVDNLPRKVEQAFGGGKEPLARGIEIWDVKQEELTAEMIQLPLPSGWKPDKASPPQIPELAKQQIEQAPAAPPVLGLGPGTDIPAFSLSDTAGQKVDSANFKGSVVLLSFWGPLFPKSDATNAIAQKIHEAYKDKGVKVYGVACREAAEGDAVNYAKSKNYTFPNLVKGDDICASYKVVGFPGLYVIGPDSKVAAFFQGTTTEAAVNQAVESALAPKAEPTAGGAPAPAPAGDKK